MGNHSEQRAAILLNMLGDAITSAVLEQLTPESQRRLREQLAALNEDPPEDFEIDEIIEEFERFFRFASDIVPNSGAPSESVDSGVEASTAGDQPLATDGQVPQVFETTDDAIADLNRLEVYQLAGALADEQPRTIATILNCLDASKAGETLAALSEDTRKSAFAHLPKVSNGSPNLLNCVARTMVDKGRRICPDDIKDDESGSDHKIALVLRSMERAQRGELLQVLETEDPEAADRIRDSMYTFSDLAAISDSSMQKILREVELGRLAQALKNADDEIAEAVFKNLPSRARETLAEEMELSGDLSPTDEAEARKAILAEIIRLDAAGQLVMK